MRFSFFAEKVTIFGFCFILAGGWLLLGMVELSLGLKEFNVELRRFVPAEGRVISCKLEQHSNKHAVSYQYRVDYQYQAGLQMYNGYFYTPAEYENSNWFSQPLKTSKSYFRGSDFNLYYDADNPHIVRFRLERQSGLAVCEILLGIILVGLGIFMPIFWFK